MPVSTDPMPDQPPPEQPSGEQPAEQQPAQPATAAAAPELPDGYPKVMVKGEHSRRAESAPQEVHLRAQGFRAADDPPVTRGGFLPPVSRSAAAEEPDTEAADKPKRRRKTEPTE